MSRVVSQRIRLLIFWFSLSLTKRAAVLTGQALIAAADELGLKVQRVLFYGSSPFP